MRTQVGHYNYFPLITILLAVHPKTDPCLPHRGPLAIHPMVRANRAIMWLGRFRKDHKGLSIFYI